MSRKSHNLPTDSQTALVPAEAVLDFAALVTAIRAMHAHCAAQASRAVNISLTLRNWVIGGYIVEYEQHGADRAEYGNRMMERLSAALIGHGIPTCDRQRLYAYVAFYRAYPQIREALPGEWTPRWLAGPATAAPRRVRSMTGQLGCLTTAGSIFRSPTGEIRASGKALVEHLSYTHLELLVRLDDALMQTFYAIECMRGNWSVRELRRQIGSMYFERSGLSKNPAKLAALVHRKADPAEPRLAIRDPYIFEFLGIRSHEVMGESQIEDGLHDKLQAFLLEMGHGFCFEARQKRILIGDTYGFVDLVFYHRILKCHVLIELKVAEFSHEHLGQLNTYVNWYKRNVMTRGDNPPVGLLLCTHKDQTLVEYALADLPNRLFVSKYQLELPSREELRRFLTAQIAGDEDRGPRPPARAKASGARRGQPCRKKG